MRYKILLIGESNSIISDFFRQLDKDFECLTSSARYADFVGHIAYFQPDIVVYCMNSESRNSMATVISVHYHMKKANIPLALICDSEDRNAYGQLRCGTCELLLPKPISITSIRDKLIYYLQHNAPADKKSFPLSLSGGIELSDLEAMARESMEDEGTFPAPPGKETEVSDIPESSAMPKISFDDLEDEIFGSQKRILVIDDSTVMLRTINDHLKSTYAVATAINGRLARKYLADRHVDLILLDYDMPNEDGPAVFEKILQNPLTADIPVVFLTGINDAQKIQRALSLKPAGYLLKPIDRETLLKKVHEVIG